MLSEVYQKLRLLKLIGEEKPAEKKKHVDPEIIRKDLLTESGWESSKQRLVLVEPESAFGTPEELEMVINCLNKALWERTSGSETLHGSEPGMEPKPLVNDVEALIEVLNNVDEFSNYKGVEADTSEHQEDRTNALHRRLRRKIAIASCSNGRENEVATIDELLQV